MVAGARYVPNVELRSSRFRSELLHLGTWAAVQATRDEKAGGSVVIRLTHPSLADVSRLESEIASGLLESREAARAVKSTGEMVKE